MSDPLDRDLFFDRPDHPDFWKLSEVMLSLDAQATEDHKTLPEVASEYIDPEVLTYVAVHRAGTALRAMGLPAGLIPLLATMWTDAFVNGARFTAGRLT